MKIFAHTLLFVAFFASAPVLADPLANSSTEEGKLTLVDFRAGADLAKYRTILFAPLAVPPEVSHAVPPGAYPEESPVVQTNASDVRRLQDAFARAMNDATWINGLKVVTVPDNTTLIVYPRAEKIVLNPQVDRGRYGIDYLLVRTGGSFEIGAVLVDGATHRPVAELAERDYPAQLWAADNRLIHWSDAGDVFDAWAGDLADTLRSR
jgi:hypothetical protein